MITTFNAIAASTPHRVDPAPIIGAAIHRRATGQPRLLTVLMLCAALCLAGCSSVHFGYNQAPRLIYWWLDGYVDLDDAQAPPVKLQIAAWLQWHRRSQLPDYAALLARAQAEVVEPTTPEQACRWFDIVSVRVDSAFEQALPGFVALVQMLKPAQIDNIRRKLERNNEVFRKDYLQPDPSDRRRADLKRAVERSETIYGRFDADQRAQIGSALAQSPFDAERWLVERSQRQQDMLQTLTRLVGEQAGPREIEAALRGLKERTEHSPRPSYRAYQEALVTANCRIAAQIHNLTTAAQRRNAADQLRAWESDLRQLTAEQAG